MRSFTKVVLGDDRPKQFCRLLGRRTLLQETRTRVSLIVEPPRTVYVVTRAHAAYYEEELTDVRRAQVIDQPSNRGTTAAVAYTLVRIGAADSRAVVGFFPADHHYQDVSMFRRTVAAAYALAEAQPHVVVLIGAEATRAETDYGWIEPGLPIGSGAAAPLARRVERFCEKPAADVARDLYARGCLWNTLVVVGSLRAFEELLAATVPGLWDTLGGGLRRASADGGEDQTADLLYARMGQSDFSRDVLSKQTGRLAVMTLPGSGWTDLGQPDRVLDVVAHRREPETQRAVG